MLHSHRILQVRVITGMFALLALSTIIVFFVCFGIYDYPHIPEQTIHYELYRKTTPYLIKKKTQCKYDDILASTENIVSWDIPKYIDDFSPIGIANGSYVPECYPAFSVAILVTYRNRKKQLDLFLPYMHNFLRKQNIHYKIYVIEQRDAKPWNKGMLYNIGARHAIADGFPCLILHDVDLLPQNRRNLYACARRPRHMSACVDTHRYFLWYEELVGGVLAIRADHYVAVEGYSNRYEQWGAEDDDMYERIHAHHLDIVRFGRTYARYTMMRHAPQPLNPDRRRILEENTHALTSGAAAPPDGYRTVSYRSLEVQLHRLFTLIVVNL